MAELQSTKKAFVTGWPVKHSKSPLIHGHWLAQFGIDGSYEPIAVEPDGFNDFISGLAENRFAGGNVTLPHKEAAYRAVDVATSHAQKLQAVNTLWFEDGKLHGDNTDGYGFSANLDAANPGWDRPQRGIATKAVILGAGGASRAIIDCLQSRGFGEIIIINRTIQRAQTLVDHFGEPCLAQTWDQLGDHLNDCDLVINTTSLGLEGTSWPDLSLEQLPKSAIVTDIVYTPLDTYPLQRARACGLRTVDGLGMLLHQAVPGFERWFGVRPQVTKELHSLVVAALEGTK
ncbi:MAG: shikimate dehydrogenase [Pseudomonadota bacterium]